MQALILIFDPARSTGYCVATVSDRTLKIIKYGVIVCHTSVKSEYDGDILIEMRDKCTQLIHGLQSEHGSDIPLHIGIEDFFFSRKSPSGSNMNVAYRAMLWTLIRDLGLVYRIINISQWKGFIAKRSRPTRLQVQKWGALKAKKLFIVEALEQRYHVTLPENILNDKNNIVKMPSDIPDAVAMCIYYSRILLQPHTLADDSVVFIDPEFETRQAKAMQMKTQNKRERKIPKNKPTCGGGKRRRACAPEEK